MSFILDALKKAEHARPPASMPQMPSAPVAATGLEKRRQPPAWMLAGGGALTALVIAGLAWLFLHDSPTAASASQAVAAPVPQPVAISQNRSVAAVSDNVQPPAVEPRRAEVRPLDSEARAGQPEPAVVAPSPRAASSASRTSGFNGRVAPGTVVYEDLSNEPPVQRGSVRYQRNFSNETASPEATSRGSAGSSGTPLYSNKKLTGAGLPNLHMDIHVFSTDPAKRFIFINSRKYRQGQETREGILVEEITPVGAIMSYQGERFSMARN